MGASKVIKKYDFGINIEGRLAVVLLHCFRDISGCKSIMLFLQIHLGDVLSIQCDLPRVANDSLASFFTRTTIVLRRLRWGDF